LDICSHWGGKTVAIDYRGARWWALPTNFAWDCAPQVEMTREN
jgi:hypothetical protein